LFDDDFFSQTSVQLVSMTAILMLAVCQHSEGTSAYVWMVLRGMDSPAVKVYPFRFTIHIRVYTNVSIFCSYIKLFY